MLFVKFLIISQLYKLPLMKLFRYVLNGFLVLSGAVLLAAGILLGYLSFTDYQPAPVIPLKTSGLGVGIPHDVHNFSMLSWNVGYCGLGKESDFFYDGGKEVRAGFDAYQKYLNGVLSTLTRMDTLDFVLLQEVDNDSKRSYYTNQQDIFSKEFKDFNTSFATNYDVKYIPFPFMSPMSKVLAGQLSMSRFKPVEASRIAAPSNFSWPKRLFFLDRCFLLTRYPVAKDTSLVVINLHNSAWAEGSYLRKDEMELLKATVLQEYRKGNYVVVGGDWNQNPPDFNPTAYDEGDKVWIMPPPLEKNFFPEGWHWAYDAKCPSNRDVSTAYLKGKTLTTVIDFFLLSPNVQLNEIRTLNKGFENSDHNPVFLSFTLGNEIPAAPEELR